MLETGFAPLWATYPAGPGLQSGAESGDIQAFDPPRLPGIRAGER
jgi:hypothetical protein